MASGTCSADSECAVLHNSLDWKCNEGSCARSCAGDRDCSPSGHGTATFNGTVCGADGFCASLVGNCSDETQCGAVNGMKTFCVDAATGTTGAVSSSISD